mmetsp:Transcript_9046/g.13594  ORF Transcript_9046/g.13594 Transcript_9046/m.13594 type:complete len:383 (-) Transcript_9046:52-1200(-)|eukprot:CAMPEP_0185034100 /NCGR_PEP_ID=MMETSP1103-20130426/23663_1 /TAXON_ID=36769 /ORGANISM="Paraphysomonas bandaiensis, Strain Caron Lab Isolate" /LENGTH=382 /DNA_ID=CAMNT_0027570617 /DNA_START=64 /DNA_END=1212 /DNA_ORIENTATION=-
MTSPLTEIFPFLDSDDSNVKSQALTILASVVNETNSSEFCQSNYISKILDCFNNSELCIQTATLLTNIVACGGEFDGKITIEKVMEILSRDLNNESIDIYLMLLTNLTTSEDISDKFISTCNKHAPILQQMIDKFLDYNPQLVEGPGVEFSEIDKWQHFASILCNICRLENGRTLLLDRSTDNMSRLTRQIRSANAVRRRGVVGSIRSCLFDSNIHFWMIEEVNVVTPLLLPLVVNTPFTEQEKQGMDPILWMQGEEKIVEPELDIQKMLLECIILLCQKRAMRDILRQKKAYYVVRNLDYAQDDSDISDTIYEIVNLLMGNEEPLNDTAVSGSSKPTNDTAMSGSSKPEVTDTNGQTPLSKSADDTRNPTPVNSDDFDAVD